MTALNYIGRQLRHGVNSLPTDTDGLKGRVIQVVGTVIKAVLPRASIGELCYLKNPGDPTTMWAEIVGFAKSEALLAPLSELHGISARTQVIPTYTAHRVPVGDQLLGRVLDGMGLPIDLDSKPALNLSQYYPVHAAPPDPLTRRPITLPLELGVKAIDGLLTCGEGQRMGIFAAAGVGKSSLLAMLARHAQVDVTVVALIGERGREVREFIDDQLGEAGMAKSVVVVATSDKPVMQRVKAPYVATAIAEYFRDQGKRVLLLMDSVTRFARGLREIGLAAGEAPTRRGYPPSVFSEIPRLLERSGQGATGSITGFYTVLVEGDDMNEPISDEIRSVLDGHIILSRKLASANQFPAIDILDSCSRIMDIIVAEGQKELAGKLRQLLAKHQEIELLVRMGEYKRGNDALGDEALDKINAIRQALKQRLDEKLSFEQTINSLQQALYHASSSPADA